MTAPNLLDGIHGHWRRGWHRGQGAAVRPSEEKRVVGPARHVIALFVHGTVMSPTEKRKIGQDGRPTLRPVSNVMSLAASHPAAREAAARVPMLESPP